MEELTKQQIVLLVLLVSFVTSIATGIVTVSLMNQAPVGITQTINRVVEKTIERVVTPSATSTDKEVIRETIVVDQGDEVVKAIQKNSNSLVRIYKSGESDGIVFVSIGTVISDDGVIATDNGNISESGKYFITTDDSKLHDLIVLRATSNESIALLKMKQEDKNLVTFTKVNFNTADLQLGQSVAFIGGDAKNTVATGIVSSLNTKEASTTKYISSIETTIPSKNFISGGLLLNLSGDLVGIKVGDGSTFIPSAIVQNIFNLYSESLKKNS